MPIRSLVLRSLCLFSMAVWAGGFTFYGGVVVPILNQELDHLQAGGITRRVTQTLNGIGLVTAVIWAIEAWAGRRARPAWARRARLGLLAASVASLVGLILLHRIMGRTLDDGGFATFYPLHKAYLATSTGQWLANLGILVASLVLWTAPRSTPGGFDFAGTPAYDGPR